MIENLCWQIEARKKRLPLNLLYESQSIWEAIKLEWTYHSCAIEGNSLSLRETQVVLAGLTLGRGKSVREHLEVLNHAAAVDQIKTKTQTTRAKSVTERTVRDVHGLLMRGIDDLLAGRYRRIPVRISGSRHAPPLPDDVPHQMRELFEWLRTDAREYHVIRRAARFHHRLTAIHPFADGNGRTARLLMNLLLMQNGYPPAIVQSDQKSRSTYMDALEIASTGGNLEPFEQVIAEALDDTMDRCLRWTHRVV